MKKQKPITLKRSKIRKSTRKPMPPPAQEHADKRRREKYPPKDAEQE
jgi:hypothetical protein